MGGEKRDRYGQCDFSLRDVNKSLLILDNEMVPLKSSLWTTSFICVTYRSMSDSKTATPSTVTPTADKSQNLYA